MSVMKKTAAAAAIVAALGTSALAQDAQQPEQQTQQSTVLTTDEAATVKKYFQFNACVQPKMPDQFAVMFGQISREEAQKQADAAIAECETSVGVNNAELETAVEALQTKYGEQVDAVVKNSYNIIYSDLTEEDKAAIQLLAGFRACAKTEQATYEAAQEKWYAEAKAAFDAKVAGGMDEAEAEAEVLAATPAPAEPDIQSICTEQAGISDIQAFETQLQTLVNQYGRNVLNAPAPQN